MSTDHEENLRLLTIFHYIVGGLAAVFALFPVFHLIFGLIMVLMPNSMETSDDAAARVVGWMFILIAVTIITVGWVIAGCIVYAGRSLAQRKRYMFCLVMAGVMCLFMPFGTILGVFTIIVLTQEPVRILFGQAPTTPQAPAE